MSLQFQTESLVYRVGNLREIITYRCDISGGFIQYLTGISIHGIIVWNQWLSAPDFKTESLVYWMDINGKSLLTCVVSIAVSFNTRRGFQWRNHCAESMIISSDFKTESFIDIHRKSLLTCVVSIAASFSTRQEFQSESLLTAMISMAVSFNTRRGFQSPNHWAESMIISSDFKTESLVYRGGKSTRNHYLPSWYQWGFHSILGRDFNPEIFTYLSWYQWRFHLILGRDFNPEIFTYPSWYQWRFHLILAGDFNPEIITYRRDINGGFIPYSAGISIGKYLLGSTRDWHG